MNLPNLITIGRIISVPLIIWLIVSEQALPAFLVFVAAGVSDAIDGFIAKHYAQATELGSYLDPIADKLLLVSIYVALGMQEILPAWLAILVVSRDVLIVGGFLLAWLLGRPAQVVPLMVSKVTTVVQIVLAAIVLGALGFDVDVEAVVVLLIWCVAALTIVSASAYMRIWVQHMANGNGHHD